MEPSTDERAAVDALLGAPDSPWSGGERTLEKLRSGVGGHQQRSQRHLLLPGLQALQARVGWISEGGLNYVCRRLGVPPAEAWGVATFYSLLATTPRPRRVLHVCEDLACLTRGARGIIDGLRASSCIDLAAASAPGVDPDRSAPGWIVAPCLGLCDQAPAAYVASAGVAPREASLGGLTLERALRTLSAGVADETVAQRDAAAEAPLRQQGATDLRLLRRVGTVDPTSITAYRAAGGFTALESALQGGAEEVIRTVTESGLVGRGGAAFPTGRKWQAVRSEPARPHYLICNADESEPGTFKDRLLLTHDPFAIVEAMIIAGFATGCSHGFVYLRGEYPLAHDRVANALAACRDNGYLGRDVRGSGFGFDIEIRRGAGAYICGEETAIFESIEGKRGEPRNKPPFPFQVGLFGKPTLVNNVETLANVPWILEHGADEFRKVGTQPSPGTRLFCLSGAVAAPGVYELPLGTSLREAVQLAGGVPGGEALGAVLLGGAAGSLLGPSEIDLPLTHEAARAAGHSLGSGVILVFDQRQDLFDVLRRVAAFFRDESCGQCVPCRVGTVRQEEALTRLCSAPSHAERAAAEGLIGEIGAAMRDGSICGLGQTASSVIETALARFPHLRAAGSSKP
ncbi:MAG: NAD(P)H-dependent oxidoreductase subunit E [Planctomycetota bacterium]